MRTSLNVLIVEDDFLIRACLADFLRDSDIAVLEAESCAEALAHLSSAEPIDALITDISLPDGNGKTLSQQARDHRPGLPVIFTTGYGAGAEGLQSALQPNDQVLSKPYPLASVLTTLQGIVRSEASARG